MNQVYSDPEVDINVIRGDIILVVLEPGAELGEGCASVCISAKQARAIAKGLLAAADARESQLP